MKKLYILAVAAFAMAFSANAQLIDDNFDFYNLGDMGDQAPGLWTNWSQDPVGSPGENMIVTDVFAASPDQAGVVNTSGQDAILLFGNQSSGDYTFALDIYIPSGQSGYYNVQGEIPGSGALSGVWNSGDMYFNQDNANAGGFEDMATNNTGSFPHDAWFPMSIYFDIDGGLEYTITLDGVDLAAVPFQTDGIVGGIDFFFAGANDEMYIDNIIFQEGPLLANNDFAANVFSVYPNPVTDILNISTKAAVNSVVVYDILGKVVLQVQPDTISPSIDMSVLSSGSYLVQVTIDGATKTVKVIK